MIKLNDKKLEIKEKKDNEGQGPNTRKEEEKLEILIL